MSTVQATTATDNPYAAFNAPQSTAKVDETQDRFLKLLVTQMRNQDPLNPLDNAQVTTQLAQLSTVGGINKLNATLESLSGMFQSNQALQAAGLIGRSVLVPGAHLSLQSGTSVGGMELTQPADKVTVSITDMVGNLLRALDLGAQSTGVISFGWDGKTDAGAAAPDGNYQFSVKTMLGDKTASAQTLALGTVSSVALGATGISLEGTGLDGVALANVKQIF